MGIDADFWFTIPPDADFPDDVTVERAEDNAPGDTRTYFHQGILSETEKELKAALDGQDQYREQCRTLTTEGEIMRKALERIANYNGNQRLTREADDMADIAREALVSRS